jgi:hypothetical protein
LDIEAVMPISDREPVRRNLERAELLLESFNLFWRGRQPLKLHIVCPDSETASIADRLDSHRAFPNLALNYLSESQINPELGKAAPGVGTAKQMLIKLAAPSFVKTPFYLTLDTDILACRPFQAGDLFWQGKALTEWETPTLHEWWYESAKVLRMELTPKDLQFPRLYVTPLVLSCEIVRRLTSHIETIYQRPWIDALLSVYTGNHPHIWTEYTLYDLFARRERLLPLFHRMQPPFTRRHRLHCKPQCVWMPEQHHAWQPLRALSQADSGLFIVVQSITAHDYDFSLSRDRWCAALKAHFEFPPLARSWTR